MDAKTLHEMITVADSFRDLVVEFRDTVCCASRDCDEAMKKAFCIAERLEETARDAKEWIVCVNYDRMESELESISGEEVTYDD
jgi:hypothetical protein